jgi:hypothetical protein
VLKEHLYLHATKVQGKVWAVDDPGSGSCDRNKEETDFMNWVFNAASVLKERVTRIALNEGLTYAWDAKQRALYAQSRRYSST